MFNFERTGNAFNFVFEKELEANSEIIVEMPIVSPNKRGINDIGWQTDGDNVTLFGTLSGNPEGEAALWQEIKANEEVNKTVSAIKIVNGGDACRIAIRAILN